jgi:hypothetical protein
MTASVHYRMDQDDEEQEGIVSTLKNTVVDTTQAGLGMVKSGFEGAKDVALATGSAVSGAVSSLARRQEWSESPKGPPADRAPSRSAA